MAQPARWADWNTQARTRLSSGIEPTTGFAETPGANRYPPNGGRFPWMNGLVKPLGQWHPQGFPVSLISCSGAAWFERQRRDPKVLAGPPRKPYNRGNPGWGNLRFAYNLHRRESRNHIPHRRLLRVSMRKTRCAIPPIFTSSAGPPGIPHRGPRGR